MATPLLVVDAFAAGPFTGNPAAVCLLDAPRDEAWMQAVAAEMNLSETAFVVPRASRDYDLRWFTPACEVELCGHATLASAHALRELGRAATGDTLAFHTASGTLHADLHDDGEVGLDFPATPAGPAEVPTGLLAALGTEARTVLRTRFDVLVEVADEPMLLALTPDQAALGEVDARGIIVTAPAQPDRAGVDFVSRFFCPRVGIAEDPVTGSAHCALAPFWADRIGRTALVGYQASPRGGIVRVEARGDRVALRGGARTTVRGELLA